MICPQCKDGRIRIEEYETDGYSTREVDIDIICKHCRGTGKVQAKDVWHIEIRSHIVGTLYYDYKQFDGESFGINSEFEVIPLHRMEKVK